MTLAAYLRVSTPKQSDEGISLEMQAKSIAQYCAALGWPEPIMYTDAGISAFKERVEHRPAFARDHGGIHRLALTAPFFCPLSHLSAADLEPDIPKTHPPCYY